MCKIGSTTGDRFSFYLCLVTSVGDGKKKFETHCGKFRSFQLVKVSNLLLSVSNNYLCRNHSDGERQRSRVKGEKEIFGFSESIKKDQ